MDVSKIACSVSKLHDRIICCLSYDGIGLCDRACDHGETLIMSCDHVLPVNVKSLELRMSPDEDSSP